MTAINGGRQSDDVINYLLDLGADVNRSDPYGRTALIEAAMWDRTELVRQLVDQGADVNASDKFGYTPILSAVAGCDLETVQHLVRHGADPSATTATGDSVFHQALSNPNAEDIIPYLIGLNLDIDAKTDNGETALFRAVERRVRTSVIALLLDLGADPCIPNANGIRPVDLADAFPPLGGEGIQERVERNRKDQ